MYYVVQMLLITGGIQQLVRGPISSGQAWTFYIPPTFVHMDNSPPIP